MKKSESSIFYDDFYKKVHFPDASSRLSDKPFEYIRLIEERYDLEAEFLRMTVNGNEQQAIKYYEKLLKCIMPLRIPDELRDRKDLCITLNTLLRKTAEMSGVHPVHIDAYSNGNVKQIEELLSVEQCHDFSRKIICGYIQMIKEFNLQKYSLPIRRTITYIRTDLTANLSLSTLAEMLNVNPSYLSTLFKKEIGIPLTEYVNRCRITQAQHFLRTTDLPIKTIAQNCGISDLNYFIRMFKRITGVTPKTYRTQTLQELPAFIS